MFDSVSLLQLTWCKMGHGRHRRFGHKLGLERTSSVCFGRVPDRRTRGSPPPAPLDAGLLDSPPISPLTQSDALQSRKQSPAPGPGAGAVCPEDISGRQGRLEGSLSWQWGWWEMPPGICTSQKGAGFGKALRLRCPAPDINGTITGPLKVPGNLFVSSQVYFHGDLGALLPSKSTIAGSFASKMEKGPFSSLSAPDNVRWVPAWALNPLMQSSGPEAPAYQRSWDLL